MQGERYLNFHIKKISYEIFLILQFLQEFFKSSQVRHNTAAEKQAYERQ